MATQAKVTDRFVTVNGLRIHYLDWGNEQAQAIIMLHGLRGIAHEWDGLSRELCDTYHVLALDQRGRGESDWDPEANYNTDAYVSDLEQFVDQLGLDRFILMGHSMGGSNTVAYISRHPEKVAAAVIEDSGPRPATGETASGPRIAQEMENTPMEFASWTDAEALQRSQRPLMSDEALKLRLEYTMKELPNGRIAWRYDIQGIKNARGGSTPPDSEQQWSVIRAIPCPTLVLRGGVSDALSGDTAEQMARANPNIRWVEVPNATHYVKDDNPEVYRREVLKSLAEIR